MKSKNGFTLIELMVVVLIVAILAAVLVPLLTARLESARWSEGKAGAGTIATAIRALYAEMGDEFTTAVGSATPPVSLFCNPEDLFGKYFAIACYQISNLNVVDLGGAEGYPVTYTIVVTNPSGDLGPNGTGGSGTAATWKVTSWTLTETGRWTRQMP